MVPGSGWSTPDSAGVRREYERGDVADAVAAAHGSGTRITDDGDVLTAGGVTSGIDLALHVLEREFGPDVDDDVARELEYERAI